MKRSAPILALLPVVGLLGLTACEEDALMRQPDPPDAGFAPDAEVPDVGFPDAATPDVGIPDAGTEPATEPVYVHTGDTLYSYEPATNRLTLIGNFGGANGEITNMVDIAIDLGGRMFGGTSDKSIYQIDPASGHCTYLSTYDDALNGMTFISDGRLVVAGQTVSVVDPYSGRSERTLVPAGVFETSGDIVGLPDGKLYWTVRGARGEGDKLVSIDPSSGRPTLLGQGSVAGLYGLGYAYGVLYGFSRDGIAVTLDKLDGKVVEEKSLAGRWYGATTNPVLW